VKIKNLSTKQKIFGGISTPTILLLLLGILVTYNINEIVATNHEVDHTHRVLDGMAGVARSAVDMETGMRGYLLSGKDDFLEPYNLGEKRAFKGITTLQEIVSDNPAQVQKLEKMWDILNEWRKNVTEPNIALRRNIAESKSIADLATLVGKARGKVFFDEFRIKISTFIRREKKQLEEHGNESRNAHKLVEQKLVDTQTTGGWVKHTVGVLDNIDNIFTNVMSMKTGVNGYLLIGEQSLLTPYLNREQLFYKKLKALSQQVSDNPAQVIRLKEIGNIIDIWSETVAKPSIDLRYQVNEGTRTLNHIAELGALQNEKVLFDNFFAEIRAFRAVESTLLQNRLTEDLATNRVTADKLNVLSSNESNVLLSNEIIRSAITLLSSAVDMETGMRGYLLTGKEPFLKPYRDGAFSSLNETRNLVSLLAKKYQTPGQTVIFNDQQHLLVEITKTLNNWKTIVAEPTINLRREVGDSKTLKDMSELVGEANGKQYFDQFRLLIQEFEDEERRLMNLRVAATHIKTEDTYWQVWIALTGSILIGIILTVIIGNNIANPLSNMTLAIQRYTEGETNIRIFDTNRKDEIGFLVKAFNQFTTDLIEKDKRVASENEIRKEAENKALAASRAKSDFLSTMSHEIRTPLNGVLGMTQLLRDTDLNDEQRTKVETILSAGESLLAIINDVLDMSKIEAGSVELENIPFDLKDLTSSLTNSYLYRAEELGVDFNLEFDTGSVSIFGGDPVRLQQILVNLLSNAFKFTESGSITLKIGLLEADNSDAIGEADHTVRIDVSDTGKGISPDRLPDIFHAFSQEDETITREFGGTGLGLAIVHNLVEMMGGNISVTSVPLSGTQFKLLIPFEQVDENEIENIVHSMADRTEHVEMRSLRILVAEDNQVNALIARSFLEKLGHDVTLVENGQLAVEKVYQTEPFDLIFMDIHMPVMDGMNATKKIREVVTDKELSIVGLTAEAFTERHKEFIDIGMNDVLTKPFTEEQLVNIILKNTKKKTPIATKGKNNTTDKTAMLKIVKI